MSPAETILQSLDQKLDFPVELSLYGRAALYLGYENPARDYALSRDVDAVLWIGQAEELAASTNFWEALQAVNQELADQNAYISHLFTEDQVVLRPQWREQRVPIFGPWRKLRLSRLSDVDLFLSKMMRDDPLDQADARFIVDRAGLTPEEIRRAIESARVPAIPEIEEQFAICSKRFLP